MLCKIVHGDCIEVMGRIAAERIDAIVTDPPYELGFMGKSWDNSGIANNVGMWKEALRVLKPGGHLLAFGGSRTYHRMVCAVEDAGFEIRDQIMWVYGSGFPKSKNLPGGLGTALKPAHEPIVVARKPFAGTVAANVETHGTGALNIDACRVATTDTYSYPNGPRGNSGKGAAFGGTGLGRRETPVESNPLGRWPANFAHDGGEETTSLAGDAARFFYCAKPSVREREEGLEGMPTAPEGMLSNTSGQHITRRDGGAPGPRANHHPTVKPVALMRWLCRLVTPPGGIVLDPFVGSGTTGKAAAEERFHFVGIEKDARYYEIAKKRLGSL